MSDTESFKIQNIQPCIIYLLYPFAISSQLPFYLTIMCPTNWVQQCLYFQLYFAILSIIIMLNILGYPICISLISQVNLKLFKLVVLNLCKGQDEIAKAII
ncbi:MAG TPA: hypothetical protein DER33_03865 [Syntrophomonas sp.]|nr:hypothetical protein [Syntrophomonas sp.]HCF70720.1 hypothetical protein [Syntrophomonas sp.]